MNYGSTTSCWKPWRWVSFEGWGMRDIYINSNLSPPTKFTSSSGSTEFKDILSWNISQMITKTISIGTRVVISHAMKRGILFWVYGKVNGNWNNNMIRISQWQESYYRTNTSIRRKKVYQFHQNRLAMMDIKVPRDKQISRWVDLENLIYVRWKRIKNRE